MSRRVRTLVTSTLLLALASVAMLRIFGNRLDPFDADRFDSARWRAIDPDDRAHMTRDLLRTYLRPGMSKSEVHRLIGSSDRSATQPPSSQTPSAGGCVELYDLGYWRLHGIGHAFLRIEFDANDQMTDADIRGM